MFSKIILKLIDAAILPSLLVFGEVCEYRFFIILEDTSLDFLGA